MFADSTLCVATTVDLRFKLFPFDTEACGKRAREATLTHMELASSITPAPTATAMAPSTADGDRSASLSLWDKLNRAMAAGSSSTATTRRQACERELKRYIDSPVIAWDSSPYGWWALNH